MNAWDFIKDVESNRGAVLFSRGNKRLCRLCGFWGKFTDDDRPFRDGVSVRIRKEGAQEEPVEVPRIVLSKTDLFHLAIYNGSRGLLRFDEVDE